MRILSAIVGSNKKHKNTRRERMRERGPELFKCLRALTRSINNTFADGLSDAMREAEALIDLIEEEA